MIAYLASVSYKDLFVNDMGWEEVELLLFFFAFEHAMFLVKALIAVFTQEQDKERIYTQKVARALYRADHERKEDIRLNAYKFVAAKFSNLFYRDSGEEKAARDAAAARKRKTKREAKTDYLKKHTKIKHIHRMIADYKEGR